MSDISDRIKAVIYCRTARAADNNPMNKIDAQDSRCRAYAEGKNYIVEAVFADDGISGTAVDRPGFRALLAFLEKKASEYRYAVVIDDVSRLARDLRVHLELRNLIARAGGRLECPSQALGTGPEADLMENLHIARAENLKNASVDSAKETP